MSDERPVNCELCGTPATWCTCTIEDTNAEIVLLRSQVEKLIDDAETLSAFVNTPLPLKRHRELMSELKEQK